MDLYTEPQLTYKYPEHLEHLLGGETFCNTEHGGLAVQTQQTAASSAYTASHVQEKQLFRRAQENYTVLKC